MKILIVWDMQRRLFLFTHRKWMRAGWLAKGDRLIMHLKKTKRDKVTDCKSKGALGVLSV